VNDTTFPLTFFVFVVGINFVPLSPTKLKKANLGTKKEINFVPIFYFVNGKEEWLGGDGIMMGRDYTSCRSIMPLHDTTI
jgi:hypothetical protein